MSSRAGIKVIKSPYPPGIAVGPEVPFPSTEAERNRVAREASKTTVLLSKASRGQVGLFAHLAEGSAEGGYVATTVRWIETIMKATKGLREAEMNSLHDFDWTERSISAEDLRQELKAALKSKSSTE